MILEVAAAIGFAGVLGVAAYPAVALGRAGRIGVLAAVGTGVLLIPLAVSDQPAIGRLAAAIGSIVVFVKLYDLLAAGGPTGPGLLAFACNLPNIFSLVGRKRDDEPAPARTSSLWRLGCDVPALGLGLMVVIAAFRVDWTGRGFAAEHVAKVVALFVGVFIPLAAVGASVCRLLGGRALDFMDHPYAARTPADFWRRYNRPAGQFLYEDVFKPAGGLRTPIQATLAAFAVSALVHEYLFAISIGRVQAYQTTFFLLQGCAVASTVRLKPKGSAALPAIAATLAFNLASSVIFFASLNAVVPFYSQEMPRWLRLLGGGYVGH